MPMNTIFVQKFIEELPDDTDEAICAISNHYEAWRAGRAIGASNYEEVITAYGFLSAFLHQRGINVACIVLGGSIRSNVEAIDMEFKRLGIVARGAFTKRSSNNLLQASSEQYTSMLLQRTSIQFSDQDYGRMQDLLNELRNCISSSTVLRSEHKSRLLRRLETLQSELHKSMSNVDAIMVFIGDAGIVLGQFGEDVKPLVDRVRELWSIVRDAVNLCLGLPPLDLLAIPEQSQVAKDDS